MLTTVNELLRLEQQIEGLKVQLAEQPDFNLIDAYEFFDAKRKGYIHIHDLKDGLDRLGAGLLKPAVQ